MSRNPARTSSQLWTICLYSVLAQTSRKLSRTLQQTRHLVLVNLLALPRTTASKVGAANFTAGPAPDDAADDVQSDIDSLLGFFDFSAWRHRGNQIRAGNDRRHCIGNLSLALSEVGPLYSSTTQGASGALSLLPTAGALIGAPAKELWVLYKLMPLAGVLSMVLSLGGNIVPMDSTDYELSGNAFSYGGLIATKERALREEDDPNSDGNADGNLPPAERFANKVAARAEEPKGSTKRLVVTVGILCQLVWIFVLLSACYLTQSGGVVGWWCQAWGWMYLWYLMVVLSSFLENFAGVPFTKQWTIRVSKAPRVRISGSAPIVAHMEVANAITESQTLLPGLAWGQAGSVSARDSLEPKAPPTSLTDPGDNTPYIIPRRPVRRGTESETLLDKRPVVQTITRQDSGDLTHSPTRSRFAERTFSGSSNPLSQQQSHESKPSRRDTGSTAILTDLDTGFNTTGRIYMDPEEPYAVPRTPFYVIISLDGISKMHAGLRVISKAISVGVFAAGTATFSSATLITISVALTTLCMVLAAGVFGRVAALWMASEMMQTDPVLHKVVKDRYEAAEYIEAVLRKPELVFEIMGHVVVEGRCIYRYNQWLRWPTVFGILAPPFDVSKLALKPLHKNSKEKRNSAAMSDCWNNT